MSTTLTENEIKVLIDEHRQKISKLENQRALIIFWVFLILISVFLLCMVGNLLLTILSFIICILALLILIGIYPRQSITDHLEDEIEAVSYTHLTLPTNREV